MEMLTIFFLLLSCTGRYAESNTNADTAVGTFSRPEVQCQDGVRRELYEDADAICVENKMHGENKFSRISDTPSDANGKSITEKTDFVFVRDSLDVCFARFTILGAFLVSYFICFITLRLCKRRFCQRFHNDQCPDDMNKRENRASQVQRRHSMLNDCSSMERKEIVESQSIAESSEAKDTNQSRTEQKCSFREPSHRSEKQTESQCANSEEVSNSQIQNDIRELKERMVCKICLNRKMCIVFLPCNHMVTCEHCSVMLDRCAVCRTVIKGTLVVHTQF